jgi:hypothetical protein
MGNPGVTPGLPVPVPAKYPYPRIGYGYSWVWVEGIVGQTGQKPVVGSDDGYCKAEPEQGSAK